MLLPQRILCCTYAQLSVRLAGLWLVYKLPPQPVILPPIIHLFDDPTPIIHSHARVMPAVTPSWSLWEPGEHSGSEHRLCCEASVSTWLATALGLVLLLCAPGCDLMITCPKLHYKNLVYLSVSTNPGSFVTASHKINLVGCDWHLKMST